MKKLLLTLTFAIATTVVSYAQGTLQFQNTALTRMTWALKGATTTVQLPVTKSVVYGVFVGGSETPVQPLGASSTTSAGIIVVAQGLLYAIPGIDGGGTASIQVRGWSASFGSDWRAAQAAFDANVAGTLYGQTDVRSFVLGPAGSGPGVVIWSGSDTTKFRPMTVFEAVPEPSTIALGVLGLGSLLFLRRRQAK
jgi:hypothetical protein